MGAQASTPVQSHIEQVVRSVSQEWVPEVARAVSRDAMWVPEVARAVSKEVWVPEVPRAVSKEVWVPDVPRNVSRGDWVSEAASPGTSDAVRDWVLTGDEPPVPVTLHLYDFGFSQCRFVNRILRAVGTGAFHCGVEVYGREWSYRGLRTPGAGTGVFSCAPRGAGASYCESIPMGDTRLSQEQVQRLLTVLEREWPGENYDLLSRNCCHFSAKLCQCLGVGNIPSFINNLAGTGEVFKPLMEALVERTVVPVTVVRMEDGPPAW